MTFQQRKICKWGLISIFIFSFDNAFADKVVINENSCRSQEIGSASFRSQFPNACIMENRLLCQLFRKKKLTKSTRCKLMEGSHLTLKNPQSSAPRRKTAPVHEQGTNLLCILLNLWFYLTYYFFIFNVASKLYFFYFLTLLASSTYLDHV